MAPLTPAERDQISAKIIKLLAGTRYACTVLTELTSGTTNLTFRGTLAQSIPSSPSRTTDKDSVVSSVVIKYSADFASCNTEFPLDISRCIAEETMLHSLIRFPFLKATTGARVKAPRLLLFDRETNVQVLEDFPGGVDLKATLESPDADRLLVQPVATALGRDLGIWLRTFHAWASHREQASLRAEIDCNEPMRKLKHFLTYENLISILDNFPDVVKDSRGALEDVQTMAAQEFARPAGDSGEGEDWGLVHGDFWSGNILLPLPSETRGEEIHKLFVIDWEFAQFGHRAYDLGQMIGDLYERKHWKGSECALWAIEGFVEGYGRLSDEMAFRTAIHAGAQMVNWYKRRGRDDPLPGTAEQLEDLMRMGKDFIVKGWEQDREWLRGSFLSSMFTT